MHTHSALALATGLLIAVPAGPALAKGGDRPEVRTTGQCDAGAIWKLKVKQDDAGVEVEFEVDSNAVGQTWDYSVSGPGGVLSSGQRTTAGPSGSFSVELATAGTITDVFTGLATYAGQTCDTTVSSLSPSPTPSPSPSDDNPSADDKGGKRDDNSGPDDVVTDTCDDDAQAILRVKGKMATLRVDSGSRGERWQYEIRRDGKMVKQGVATTKGSKAVFKVKARSRVTGHFSATANKVGSDDVCEVAGN